MVDFHNGRLDFFGESLQKPLHQTNFRRGYICRVPYVHRQTAISYVCMCACVVVRILRSDATARHHICRNIRLAHTGEIRFTVAARMQVSRVSLARRRESHTARNLQIFSSSYVILSASVCAPPAIPCAKCNDVRSDFTRSILRIHVCNECGSPFATCNRNSLFICTVGILNTCTVSVVVCSAYTCIKDGWNSYRNI